MNADTLALIARLTEASEKGQIELCFSGTADQEDLLPQLIAALREQNALVGAAAQNLKSVVSKEQKNQELLEAQIATLQSSLDECRRNHDTVYAEQTTLLVEAREERNAARIEAQDLRAALAERDSALAVADKALENLYDTGSQVSVPSHEVARASYRLDQDDKECPTYKSHGTFTATIRPKDMIAFNEALDAARKARAEIAAVKGEGK
jgi:chromosome segregation ATPase